jgi:L-alanine-DL-glutamate epimerase-like enolase superfamily enzyme
MYLVSKNSNIPIATGERLTTKYEFLEVLRAGSASILQPALGRVGGIWEAKKVAAIAEGFGAQIAPHLYAGPIEWAANIQLSLTLPNFLLLESIGTGGGFHSKLLKSNIHWENGYVLPPNAPGLGVELDEAVARENPYTGNELHLSMSTNEHIP